MRRSTISPWVGVIALFALNLGLSLYNLGSRTAPQTFWEPRYKGEGVLVDLGRVEEVGRISFFNGVIWGGTYRVEYSQDGTEWQAGPLLKPSWVFHWEHCDGPWEGRFFRIVLESPRSMLGEVGFFRSGEKSPLPIAAVELVPSTSRSSVGWENLFDEQETVQYEHSYLNGTYFDEIYHARTAYEHLYRLEPYEWTHPPLGKIIIAVGIALFGMNPWGFRIMGVLFGALLIPLFYLFARLLFPKEKYVLFVTFLFTFEFMRFVQARIATIDTYVVFFVVGGYYFLVRFFSPPQGAGRRNLSLLLFSGIFFGCGAATKWTVLYAGLGMFIFFLSSVAQEWRTDVHFRPFFWRTLVPWCVVFFILVPAGIYALSYLPYVLVPEHDYSDLFHYQGQMYGYHKNLKATHPFASPWWEWPAIIRPIWLYKGEGLPPGKVSSIVSLGNPAIWWLGAILLLALVFFPALRKGPAFPVILAGFFSQYLPWVLVPRITFIYHYYGCVPFLILLIGVFFQTLEEENPHASRWLFLYGVSAVVLFLLFYPILSGFVVSQNYVARFLQWLPSWTFYSGG